MFLDNSDRLSQLQKVIFRFYVNLPETPDSGESDGDIYDHDHDDPESNDDSRWVLPRSADQ